MQIAEQGNVLKFVLLAIMATIKFVELVVQMPILQSTLMTRHICASKHVLMEPLQILRQRVV